MTSPTQLLGISNAIVDILAHVEHDLIAQLGIVPGSMNLIDEERAREIYALTGPAIEMSGGSVANTVAGFANLGGASAYIGRVRDDQFGEIFNHDMRSLGVDIRLEPGTDGAPTARSHVLITDDGQRTMNTYLGACTELATADINAQTVGAPKVILLEGYVWDLPEGPKLTRRAMDLGHTEGAAVALSLSDSFCVERHLQSFRDSVSDGVDIVLGNEAEICTHFGVDSFDAAVVEMLARPNLFAITRSEKGSVIVADGNRVDQPAETIGAVVDTTGAGDAWSAGFLYGLVQDWSHADCARLGTHCASNVIQQIGARIDPGLLETFE
ncbi:MAG: adenosine kinase [Pseudomonadota bacterium]